MPSEQQREVPILRSTHLYLKVFSLLEAKGGHVRVQNRFLESQENIIQKVLAGDV